MWHKHRTSKVFLWAEDSVKEVNWSGQAPKVGSSVVQRKEDSDVFLFILQTVTE